MKKLSILLIFVAALFVVLGQSCRKSEPLEDEDPIVLPPGGGIDTTDTTNNTTDTTTKYGTITIFGHEKDLLSKRFGGVDIGVALTRDSLNKGLFIKQAVTSGSTPYLATFTNMKVNKLYHFHGTYFQGGEDWVGDTTAKVIVQGQVFNATLPMH